MDQEPIMVTVAEGTTDCDEVWEERNTLAVALRSIIEELCEGNEPLVLIPTYSIAIDALAEVFPEDPLGMLAIYDCPSADGTNHLRDELEGSQS